jgi:predicted transcriptional regulator
VATLNVIRRWALRDQMSIREISRRTGLARNTIKKHLRSEERSLLGPALCLLFFSSFTHGESLIYSNCGASQRSNTALSISKHTPA